MHKTNKPFFYLLIFFTIMISFSFSSVKLNLEATKTILLKDKILTINGIKIPDGCKKSDLISILGEPSRSILKTKEAIDEMIKKYGIKGNNIYIYDNLGIFFFEDISKKVITNMSIEYIKGDLSYSPHKEFSGTFTVENTLINRECTIDCFKNNKKITYNKTPFYYQMNASGREYTATFIQFGKNEIIKNVQIQIPLKILESNTNGFTQQDIKMLKAGLVNDKQMIQVANKYGIKAETIADCYVNKMLKHQKSEILSGSTESQEKLKKYMEDCLINLTQNK